MSMHHFYYQTALVAAAVAQGRIYHEFITPSSPYGAVAGDTGDEQDRQRFAQANLRPNISKSFNFTPFYVDGVFNTGTNSIDESNVWTLRVNVSDFALPDARPEFPGEEADFVDPHITNTVFSLDWHQDESFRSALNGSAAPVCATITTGNFLPNVTNLFTDDNDSADCEPVLGRDCVDAILASGRDLDACSFDIWTDLPECAASLGASAFYDTYGLSILSFDMNRNATGGNASFAEVGYEAIANGTDGQYGFFSQSSDPYSAANTTLFDEEATRLHVMVLSFAPDRSGVGLWSQKAMCVRANATRLNVEDGRPSDGDGGEGSGGGNISNVASTLTAGTGNMGSALALAGLWLAAFARL